MFKRILHLLQPKVTFIRDIFTYRDFVTSAMQINNKLFNAEQDAITSARSTQHKNQHLLLVKNRHQNYVKIVVSFITITSQNAVIGPNTCVSCLWIQLCAFTFLHTYKLQDKHQWANLQYVLITINLNRCILILHSICNIFVDDLGLIYNFRVLSTTYVNIVLCRVNTVFNFKWIMYIYGQFLNSLKHLVPFTHNIIVNNTDSKLLMVYFCQKLYTYIDELFVNFF